MSPQTPPRAVDAHQMDENCLKNNMMMKEKKKKKSYKRPGNFKMLLLLWWWFLLTEIYLTMGLMDGRRNGPCTAAQLPNLRTFFSPSKHVDFSPMTDSLVT